MNKKLLNRLNSNIDVVNEVIKDLQTFMENICRDRDELMKSIGYTEQSYMSNPKYKKAPEPSPEPETEQQTEFFPNLIETIKNKDGRDAIIKFLVNAFKEVKSTIDEELKPDKNTQATPPPPTPEPVNEFEQTAPISNPIFDIFDRRIDDCDFSYRLQNCLMLNRIVTVRDLLKYSRLDLFKLRNFGNKCYGELEWFLRENKLELQKD